jgi:transcription initiation factor IIE alpha subunit
VENQDSNNCDSRIHAYKNGKTMEECRQQARKTTELLSEEISKAGEVS